MGAVIITFKIMPDGPDADMKQIEEKATAVISAAEGEVGKVEVEPVAFGLKALKLTFVREEDKGSIDPIEEEIRGFENVSSCEAVDVRRAMG